MKPSLWLVSIALAVASPLAAQEPKLRTTLSGHAGAIVCLAFSADGKTLASAGADGAELWDLATGKTTFRFSQRLGQDYAAAFSPDGKTMVSGGDFSLRLWDVATGKSVRLDEDTGVLSVALSADGKTLVSGSGGDEHNVKLWDMSARRRSSILDDEALHCVALSGRQNRGVRQRTRQYQALERGHRQEYGHTRLGRLDYCCRVQPRRQDAGRGGDVPGCRAALGCAQRQGHRRAQGRRLPARCAGVQPRRQDAGGGIP